MHVRIQARSFDAMCQLINANLGIGVLPLAVVRATQPHPLKIVRLSQPWARRKLLLGVSQTCSSAALLLRAHLQQGAMAPVAGNAR